MKVIKLKVNDKQAILKICFVVSFAYCFISASGFRLPEQSLNGTALNSAYIAGAYGADATYYNPANMSLGRESNEYAFEIDGSLIFIPGFSFDTAGFDKGICTIGTLAGLSDGCFFQGNQVADKDNAKNYKAPEYRSNGKAKTTIQPVPKFFFKSRAYELPSDIKMNYGISFTTPSGLAMDWDGEGGGFLDDVSIAMLEFNPVVSLSWNDFIAIGGGLRVIYTSGAFNNTLYVPINFEGNSLTGNTKGTTKVEQSSNASAWGFGYNVAMTIKPFMFIDNQLLQGMSMAITYRGEISLEMIGKLSAVSYIYSPAINKGAATGVNMNADLTLFSDMPHILNIALSQDFGDFTAEFVYECTFYGSARIFEFGYFNQVFDTSALGVFANLVPIDKMLSAADYSAVAYGNGWKNASAFRLGLTYFGETYNIMGSLAYDMTPAPQGQFGIPDADAYMIGIGARKKFFDNQLDVGIGYSLALKDNRKSFIVSHDGFGQLHLLTIGVKYLW